MATPRTSASAWSERDSTDSQSEVAVEETPNPEPAPVVELGHELDADPDVGEEAESAAESGLNDFVLEEDDVHQSMTASHEHFIPVTFQPSQKGDAAETEEVADPYAALDALRPSVLRTYDDRSLAEAWRGKSGPTVAPAEPPEPPADLQFDRLIPVDKQPRSSTVVPPAPRVERVITAATAPVLTRRSEEACLHKSEGFVSDLEFDVVEPESVERVATPPGNFPAVQPPGDDKSIVSSLGVTSSPAAGDRTRESGARPDIHSAHPTPAPASARTAGMGRLFSNLRRKLGKTPLR